MGQELRPAEPTITQVLYGKAMCDYEAPDFIAEGLHGLSERLGRLNPEAQVHGLLGGSWGYGQDFANDVFEMFPYYWGDCVCGHEERAGAWYKAHPHAADCYYTALGTLRSDELPRVEYERRRDALCDRYGLSRTHGCEAHCTCGRDEAAQDWERANGHEMQCPEIRPNLRHKASGLVVCWYKYIGRGMTYNRAIEPDEWSRIVDECMRSFGQCVGEGATECESPAPVRGGETEAASG